MKQTILIQGRNAISLLLWMLRGTRSFISNPARNALIAYSFLKEVLRLCEVEELILDRGSWYKDALQRLGVRFKHESFGERSKVVSVFSSLK